MVAVHYPEWAYVGARVVLEKDYPDNNRRLVSGDTGTIVDRNSMSRSLYIEWDKECNGHDCGGKAKRGHGWNVDCDEVGPEHLFCDEEIEYEPTSMDELLSLFSR